jgi:hypothetical protein
MLGALKISYTDGTDVKVTAKGVDAITFERKYDKAVSAAFGDSMRLEYLWYIAYAAFVRETKNDIEFDAWAESVESVASEDEAARPSSKRGRTSSQ